MTAAPDFQSEAAALHAILQEHDWYALAGTDAERRLHERLTAMVSCEEFAALIAPPVLIGHFQHGGWHGWQQVVPTAAGKRHVFPLYALAKDAPAALARQAECEAEEARVNAQRR
jgi:hypothetical protein